MAKIIKKGKGLIKKEGCLMVENDINFQRIIKNPMVCNLITIECYGDDWYVMREEKTSLGTKNGIDIEKVKYILSEITFVELIMQITQLTRMLEIKKVSHNNIHPGNILYNSDDKKLLLCDFNWSCFINDKNEMPEGLNLKYSTDDKKAFLLILDEISNIDSSYKVHINKDLHDWFLENVVKD